MSLAEPLRVIPALTLLRDAQEERPRWPGKAGSTGHRHLPRQFQALRARGATAH